METNNVVAAGRTRKRVLPLLLVVVMAIAVFSIALYARASDSYTNCCLIIEKDCCTLNGPKAEPFEFTMTLSPDVDAGGLGGVTHVHGILFNRAQKASQRDYPANTVEQHGDTFIIPETYMLETDDNGKRYFNFSLGPNQYLLFANPNSDTFHDVYGWYYLDDEYGFCKEDSDEGCSRPSCLLPLRNPGGVGKDSFKGSYTITENIGTDGDYVFSTAKIVSSEEGEREIVSSVTTPSVKGETLPNYETREITKDEFVVLKTDNPAKVVYALEDGTLEEKQFDYHTFYNADYGREPLQFVYAIPGADPEDPENAYFRDIVAERPETWQSDKEPYPLRWDESQHKYISALENPMYYDSWHKELKTISPDDVIKSTDFESYDGDPWGGFEYGYVAKVTRSISGWPGFAHAIFTNVRNKTPKQVPGELTVIKKLEEGELDDTKFSFELIISPQYKSTPSALTTSDDGTPSVSASITHQNGEVEETTYSISNNTVNFELMAGESVTFSDVPFLQYNEGDKEEELMFIVNELLTDADGRLVAKNYSFGSVKLEDATDLTSAATERTDKTEDQKSFSEQLYRMAPIVEDNGSEDSDDSARGDSDEEGYSAYEEVSDEEEWVYENPYSGVFGCVDRVPDEEGADNPGSLITPVITFTNKQLEKPVIPDDPGDPSGHVLTVTKDLEKFDFGKYESANVAFNVYRFNTEDACKDFIRSGNTTTATWKGTLAMRLTANGATSTELTGLDAGFYAVEELAATNMKAVGVTRQYVQIKPDAADDEQFVVKFDNSFDDQNVYENSIVNSYKKEIDENGKITWQRYKNGAPVND